MKNYIPAKKGDIVDINTLEVVGHHDGVLYYTIGQRRGLGIGGISGRVANSWFVVKKDVKKNILYVASGNEDEHLLSDRTIVKNCVFNQVLNLKKLLNVIQSLDIVKKI